MVKMVEMNLLIFKENFKILLLAIRKLTSGARV